MSIALIVLLDPFDALVWCLCFGAVQALVHPSEPSTPS